MSVPKHRGVARLLAHAAFWLGVALASPTTTAAGVKPATHVVPERYDIALTVSPSEGEANVEVRMRVRNTGSLPAAAIDLLLYRLSVLGEVRLEGQSAAVETGLAEIREFPYLQFRRVRIVPASPIPPGQARTVALTYTLALRGYAEVMGYLKDAITPDYSLFRPETAYYPLVAGTSWPEYVSAQVQPVEFALSVDVPGDYAVASGARASVVRRAGERAVHRFASASDATRLDIAVARFERIERDGIVVDALPGRAEEARLLATKLGEATRYFSRRFGAPDRPAYHVIEIPADHGSQAATGYMLLDGAALGDPLRLHEAVHEVAHGWHLPVDATMARTRWFDEAVATYMELVATRDMQGESSYRALALGLRERFRTLVEQRKGLQDAAFADYGRLELGDASYSKGAWSLLVLESRIGTEGVDAVIRRLRKMPTITSFEAVKEAVRTECPERCEGYLHDWFDGGDRSSAWLLSEESAMPPT